MARAAAARGTLMGLSSFASQPIEEVIRDQPQTLFQMYWMGGRDQMSQLDRAGPRGRRGRPDRHARLVVLARPRLGQPADPGVDVAAGRWCRHAPEALRRPRWLRELPAGRATCPGSPPRTWPGPGERAPTFFGAYGEWMQTPPPTLGRPRLAARAVGRAVHAQGRLPGRRRQAGRRRGLHRHLGVQPRRQQPRRHAGADPGAAGDRRGGRGPDRGPARRRHPPRRRRGEGAGPRRPRGHDRARLPVGPGRQRPGRRGERPRHPARRHRLRPARAGPLVHHGPRPRPT